MATIDHRPLIEDIMAGRYPMDRPIKIVEYVNDWGVTTWGVMFAPHDSRSKYDESEFVHSPRTVWEVTDQEADDAYLEWQLQGAQDNE